MKTKITALIILSIFCNGVILNAQTDPGTANLMHQWTFDDGTANDVVTTNPVHGTLIGGATIEDNVLKLSAQGQYVSFSGAGLALNTYPVIAQEIWYTPVAGANTGYSMLSYFGRTSDNLGYNFLFTTTARQDDVSRVAISDGTYTDAVYVNGPEYDDGNLHHMVAVVSSDSLILYIDGERIDKKANTIPLTTISISLAYLGKGGFTDDPTWIGSIYKFSIYNKSLTYNEVKYLYLQGAEQSPMITSKIKALSFDEFYKSETMYVSSQNLTDTIFITSPDGITVSPAKLSPDITNASVLITYDTTAIVDSSIVFTSDSTSLIIPVKSHTNSCFSKLYPDLTNLIPNPYVNSLAEFSGWGDRSINPDPAYVYCGATSGKVTGTNGGSLDVTLTGKLFPNTTYRVKAQVYTVDGNFQIGVFGWSSGMADYIKVIDTKGGWMDLDFTFTTGETLGTNQGIFFNNYGLSGTTGYIDNWEMYAVPKVYTSSSSLSYPEAGSKKVAVSGQNLLQEIIINAPDGFSVSPSTMPSNVDGDSLTVTFEGTKTTSGYIHFTSGTVNDSLYVEGSIDPALLISSPLLLMDEINPDAGFTVTGYNLNTNVTLTAPEGITLSVVTLPSTVSGTSVTASFDGTGNYSGTITLTSGTASNQVEVIAARNEECFNLLYPDSTNLITDPTLNSLVNSGQGNRSINSDPTFVYCGSRSGKVSVNGSIDRDLTGIMKPNTEYRVKASVYKVSDVEGQNMGHVTFTLAMDSSSNPEKYSLIKEAMDSACSYYNKYTPFIADIYVYYSAGIPTAQASYHGSIGFGSNTRYMWVGTAIHEMAHYFGSGTTSIWQSKTSTGTWTGKAGADFVKSINAGTLKGDNQHYWPYGINQKEEITNMGSLAVQDNALANAVKLIKAMLVDDCDLPTNNPAVGIGVYGWDISSGDIYHKVPVSNSWQDIDFTFTTGTKLKQTQKVYFSYGTGYIDNWEMYEIRQVTQLTKIEPSTQKIYLSDNLLITEFDLAARSLVNIMIYDIQGKNIYANKYWYEAGHSKHIIDTELHKGVYIVKLVSGQFSFSGKVLINY